jgi:hypothetical protein
MKLLFKNWRKHLEDQNETYFEHMLAAWRVIWILKVLELKCLVHSFFPFLFTTAVSEKIECLEKMTKRNK